MHNTGEMRPVEVAAQKVLFAVPDGRCWVMDAAVPKVAALPVSKLAAKRASFAASLIEGAIHAGLAQASAVGPVKPYTLPRYVRWLAANYVFAGQTPGLFRLGAERLVAAGRTDLARFALQKADEEEGHSDLAFRDLEGLGLPAADVIRLVQPPSAQVFADSFRAHVESDNPVALFGFSYCLERVAVHRDAEFIRTVEAAYPPQFKANRFLRVHSAVGSDADHVEEQLAAFEALGDAELFSVARATYQTAEMLGRQPAMDQALSDEEVCRRLEQNGIVLSLG